MVYGPTINTFNSCYHVGSSHFGPGQSTSLQRGKGAYPRSWAPLPRMYVDSRKAVAGHSYSLVIAPLASISPPTCSTSTPTHCRCGSTCARSSVSSVQDTSRASTTILSYTDRFARTSPLVPCWFTFFVVCY